VCGIAGFLGQISLPPERLEVVDQSLRHRGPDDSGRYQFSHSQHFTTLLHRRLSILDLDPRSSQPFRVGRKVLIFNGEIYNYIEIRHQLKRKGYTFQTTGDTEVLAIALDEWGVDALDRLEGMWAFAWYDEITGKLLISRDRFGEKPVHLWKRDEGLYFASEVKGLAALAGCWPEVNTNHLIRYLVNGYKSLYKTSETFYQDIWELPAGEILTVSPDGRQFQSRYWKPNLTEQTNWSFQEAIEETRATLIKAVRLRLRSDVPLAFCMSGGVDSNSLLSIASQHLQENVHGFTIVNSDARYEETDLVEYAVSQLGIRHTPVRLQKEGFLERLAKIIQEHDGPISTISYFVHRQLMDAMCASGYKVTISGTGADELFSGYYDHHNLYLAEIRSDPRLFNESLRNWTKHLGPVVRNPYLKDPMLFITNPKFRDHIYRKNPIYASWLCAPWEENFHELDFGVANLRNRMLNEMFKEVVPVILHEDDLNAMSVSVENRSPFLDRNLFETATKTPTRHLVRDGRAKAVLRGAMRGIVPDRILDSRRKVGFNAPILDLIDLSSRRVREEIVDNGPIYDIVQRDKIQALINKNQLSNSESKFLFNFLNVKIFLEKTDQFSTCV
jgi:asparagine synthase (glutamine-hydrolysing)